MPDDLSRRVTFPVHPAAEAFPTISEDELLELAQDIKQKGLFNPIMLDNAGVLLLDGRHRHRACMMAGIEPRYDRLAEGVDPVGYIISMNINRRNITKGQKALALALIYPEPERGRGKIDPARKESEKSSFSYARVKDARQIIRHADLVDLVKSGAMKFDIALEEAQSRARIKQSSEYYMGELRQHAPDIAERVADEHLNLQEGWTLYEKRKAEAELLERNQREAILRLNDGLIRGAIAFANDEFVGEVRERLADSAFKAKFYEQLGPKMDEFELGVNRFFDLIGAPT